MKDYLETYLLIEAQWNNKANKLNNVLITQKRLIEQLSRQRLTEDVKALLLSASEGLDVSNDLINWGKEALQEVLNDAGALKDGATMRNTIKLQSDVIEAFWAKEDMMLECFKLRINDLPGKDQKTA